MPRSSYVYVTQDDEGMPSGAFTVKRELVMFLQKHGADSVGGVVRLRDGNPEERVELDPEELIADA